MKVPPADYPQQFCDALVAEARRRLFDESFPRLKKCLAQLSEPDIWHKPNAHSNSVGNLVLHLCGNARQWIISGLGNQPDTRQRRKEFEERGPLPTAHLLELLEALQQDIEAVLRTVEPAGLLHLRQVQTFEETGLSILIHVVEHFSYHVGQVTYYVKIRKDMDMAYYGNIPLD